eukprot:COSAG02_NODE_21961_length_768_cov_1.176383_1_plen_232_part_10
MQKARTALEAKQYVDSARLYGQVMGNQHTDESTRSAVLSEVLHAEDNFDPHFAANEFAQAFDLYTMCTELLPESKDFQKHVRDMTASAIGTAPSSWPVAESLLKDKKYADAVGAFQLALLVKPDDKRLLLGLKTSQKHLKEASDKADTARAASVKKLEEKLALGFKELQAKDPALAARHFMEVRDHKDCTPELKSAIDDQTASSKELFTTSFTAKEYMVTYFEYLFVVAMGE